MGVRSWVVCCRSGVAAGAVGASTAGEVDETLVPRHGVSLDYLKSLKDFLNKTVYELCEEWVVPTTAKDKVSVAEWLLSEPKTAANVRKQADVFVSYAWAYTLEDVISAVEDAGHKHAYVWMDVVVVNQHKKGVVNMGMFLNTFSKAIGEVGEVVFVVSPWYKPVNVTRVWCVFEILCAVQSEHVQKRVAMPAKTKKAMQEAVKNNEVSFAKLMTIFGDINVHRCEAKEEDDRVAILKLIENNPAVNDAVMKPLKTYYRRLVEDLATDVDAAEPDAHVFYGTVSDVYKALGDLVQAAEWGQKAVQAAKDGGAPETEVATYLNNIALVLKSQGQLEEALEMHRQALDIRKRALGEDHPDTAGSVNNIASVFGEQGRFDEALEVHQQALDIRKRALGEGHPDVAQSLNNIASVWNMQGRLDEAFHNFRQAVDIWKRALGDDHPQVASGLNNIASVLSDQGRLDEALQNFQQALAITKRALGEDHPDVATDLNNIASVLKSQGRLDEALVMFQQALDIRKRALGEDHPDVAGSLNNIAVVLSDQGRFDEALPNFRQAIDISKRALGEDHPQVATGLNNFASVLKGQGRLDEALVMLRQALDLDKRALGEDHPDVAVDLNNIAAILSSQGKHREAVEEFTKALAIRRRALGNDHPNVGRTLWWLAIESRDHERDETKAKQYADEARRIFDTALGADHPTTVAFKKQFP